MRKFLYILPLILSALACGATLPTQPEVFTQEAIPTETAQSVNTYFSPKMSMVVGSWNFRTSPGESSPLIETLTDVKVELYDCKPYDGGMWCEVEYQSVRGWVNQRGLK